jgi:nucleotide-binding universal stress UspA family protein
VQSEAFADSPAWGIIKKAKAWKADLILVGAHGMTSAGRMLLGSISQIVATQASCTVRVVHNRAEDLRSPPRIVIGIDGSPCANTALKEAASRAWPKGTAFHLITAIDPRVKTSVLLPPSQKWLEGNDSVAHYWVGRLMEAAADKLRSRGFAVTCLKKEGDPKKILVEEAERWGADVIFIGARGLGGVKHALMGSVSSAVAARAHCVVEIVRESVPGANAKKKTTKGKVAAV